MESKHCVEFKSPSLNSKEAKTVVEVIEYNPQKAPHVAWSVGGHLLYSTEFSKLFYDLKFSVERTTIYEAAEGNIKLYSPEHLAPVFLMWPHHRFNVNLESSGEVPMMDGSAVPFFTALRRECGAPEDLVFYDAPVNAEWNLESPDGRKFGHVRVMPSETFEVEYVLDRTQVRDGFDLQSSAYVSLYAPESMYQLFMARTFISQFELDKARSCGLLKGVDQSCGFVIGEKYRIANEPAMHKILDLIGDLTFVAPALPRVRIEITNGGHVSHRQIMEKIIPYVSAGIFTEV